MTFTDKNTQSGRWVTLFALVGIAGADNVTAQETAAANNAPPPEASGAYWLGETITVVGERPRIADEVATINTVTAEDIARRGVRTLDQAIALLPGVYVRYGADGVPRIDVRGLRTRNIILLQDGVPLNSGYDGQFDPALIPAENIAEIKVTRGGSSVLYGPGGNAGVIEIITKSAGDTVRANVAGEYEFSKAYEVRGSVSGQVGGAGLSLWGSSFDRDYFELSGDFPRSDLQPGDERVNSDRKQNAVQANMVFNEGGPDLGLSLSYRNAEYGKPPTAISSSDSIYANRARYERVELDSFSAQAAAEFGSGESGSVKPTLFFNHDAEDTNGYDDDGYDSQVASGSFRENATTEVLGASVLASKHFTDAFLLSASLSGRHESWNSNGFSVTTSTGGGGGGGGGGVAAEVAVVVAVVVEARRPSSTRSTRTSPSTSTRWMSKASTGRHRHWDLSRAWVTASSLGIPGRMMAGSRTCSASTTRSARRRRCVPTPRASSATRHFATSTQWTAAIRIFPPRRAIPTILH